MLTKVVLLLAYFPECEYRIYYGYFVTVNKIITTTVELWSDDFNLRAM
jgi:hypothetical protein